jgi:hypothetical protein
MRGATRPRPLSAAQSRTIIQQRRLPFEMKNGDDESSPQIRYGRQTATGRSR